MLCRKNVVLIQRRLTHYRVPLFTALQDALRVRDIGLHLLVGQGTIAEEERHDADELAWAIRLPTYYSLGGKLCWQSFGHHLTGADLVIVTQENRLLNNHLLLLRPRRFRLAFWGHGANLQSQTPKGLRERFKRWTTNRVDWWFAYTDMSAVLIAGTGFQYSRITVVNNAVDTAQMRSWAQEIGDEEMCALRRELGIGEGPVGIFVGSLYVDKRLDFLFESAMAIRKEIPDFHLLIIGEGSERTKVRSWCQTHSWVHWVGACFGRKKVAYVALAQVMLNPGAVGLGVFDSLICAVPMVMTDCRGHGPEIVYLHNGVNGIMTANDVSAYSAAVVDLLRNEEKQSRLRAGCHVSAEKYTLENMVQRFAEGITNCLQAPRCDIRIH